MRTPSKASPQPASLRGNFATRSRNPTPQRTFCTYAFSAGARHGRHRRNHSGHLGQQSNWDVGLQFRWRSPGPYPGCDGRQKIRKGRLRRHVVRRLSWHWRALSPPLPWSTLKYDTRQGGYVVGITIEPLKGGPTFEACELPSWGLPDEAARALQGRTLLGSVVRGF